MTSHDSDQDFYQKLCGAAATMRLLGTDEDKIRRDMIEATGIACDDSVDDMWAQETLMSKALQIIDRAIVDTRDGEWFSMDRVRARNRA